MKASRHKAREYTLQILYQWDVRKTTMDEILSTFWRGAGAHPIEKRLAESASRGVGRHVEAIDQHIELASRKWRLSRMPTVDRNILRLGVYELIHDTEAPPAVVIDECIELGKVYSTTESGSFINGILDRIARESKSE